MDLATGLATLKTAFEMTKGLREALKSRNVKMDEVAARVIEIQDLIADGRSALIDAQEQLFKKNEDLAGLRRQILELQAANAQRDTLTYMHGVYWRTFDVDKGEDPEGNGIVEVHYDGPFCPTCNDADGKAVRMRHLGDYESGEGRFNCDIHNIMFAVPSGDDGFLTELRSFNFPTSFVQPIEKR